MLQSLNFIRCRKNSHWSHLKITHLQYCKNDQEKNNERSIQKIRVPLTGKERQFHYELFNRKKTAQKQYLLQEYSFNPSEKKSNADAPSLLTFHPTRQFLPDADKFYPLSATFFLPSVMS